MPSSSATPHQDDVPLCVDLDGTLIKTDLLWESFVRLLRRNPFQLLPVMYWWTRGRAFLKQQLARRVTLDPASLPYNESFLRYLREQKNNGRRLILVTASDRAPARLIAEHVGIFDEVLGSDGQTNLRSAAKLKALVDRFGERGFDYAGNSSADLAVWRGAREAVVVNARPSLVKKASGCARLGRVFEPDTGLFRALFRSLRPHQWVKNLIIFVPTLTAHKLRETPILLLDAWAFATFCLCASGVYVVNDLLDLDADRHHPAKKRRPLAAADLPLPAGMILGPALLLAGLLLALWLSQPFAAVTLAYLLLTTTYSWWIKRMALLDVFFLAGLYTIRLVAGHTATDIAYSAWLLMFSMFIFLSLALVKRYVELNSARQAGKGDSAPTGRGYAQDDLAVVVSLGTGSGYLAALVLALYVNSQQVVTLYAHPNLLLLVCPLLLYWISRVWLLAHRGRMHDDPVVFALRDPTSYAIGTMAVIVLWMAARP